MQRQKQVAVAVEMMYANALVPLHGVLPVPGQIFVPAQWMTQQHSDFLAVEAIRLTSSVVAVVVVAAAVDVVGVVTPSCEFVYFSKLNRNRNAL